MSDVADSALPHLPSVTTSTPRSIPLFDRELSWLEFNRRVLAEAENPEVPLLERLKFLSICSTNLDEFFMIRVGELRDIIASGLAVESAGARHGAQLRSLRKTANQLLRDMYACLSTQLLPHLAKNGIVIEEIANLSAGDREFLASYYAQNVEPILTPLAIDPGHPFPFLANVTLNMALLLDSERQENHTVFLKIPPLVSRFVRLPGARRYIPIEALIREHVGSMFPGMKLRHAISFRVIRNSDISFRDDEVQDLLKSVELELRRRARKEVVWIEIDSTADGRLIELLSQETGASREDIFLAPGLLKLGDVMQLYAEVDDATLKEPTFNPRIPAQFASNDDIFAIIRAGDLLLHRPYDSFASVIEFVQAAADDPDVVAIKLTLYRTDKGSPIVEALAKAVLRGKQVTAIIELQARFDEDKNIAWARRLEEAGAQVVYGIVGIKTHCKLCLVVRREGSLHRRYVHLSTGNYNAATARVYTDVDLFTCDEAFGEDASQLMNLLTGFSLASLQELFEQEVSELVWKRFIVAPVDYQKWAISMIERETRNAREGKPAQILAKMNALVDSTVIQHLYLASQAGVKIDLIIRGICCLVPAVKGISENIRVTSVVDRFLEHSRIFLFLNGGDKEIFVTSGDWMPRNFVRRIEVTYPILSPVLKDRVENQILAISLEDRVKSWKLESDGSYKRRKREGDSIRSQERFIEIARAEAIRLGPYEEMIRAPGTFRRKARKQRRKPKLKETK